MRVVLQRVSQASVSVEYQIVGEIKKGILILVGIEGEDNEEDVEWLSHKISNLRIFADDKGVMNLSVKDINGELLVISQFTLHAKTKKGNRPSYIAAAEPSIAIPLYEAFKTQLSLLMQKPVACGKFGADMKIELINDGPVTILIDSKRRE